MQEVYYILSNLGNNKLGQGNKTIKINYNELVHQNLLIKWLAQQNDIISYQTEKELKAEGHLIKDVWGNTKSKQGYPDLLVHYEDKEMIIELERTRKSKDKFKLKNRTSPHWNIQKYWYFITEFWLKLFCCIFFKKF